MKKRMSILLGGSVIFSALAAPLPLYQNDFETDTPELCYPIVRSSGRPFMTEETFRITDKDAYTGRKCIQLSPVKGSDSLTLHMDMYKSLSSWTGLEMSPEKVHTVSAWVKADQPDTAVTIRFNYKQQKQYKIGTTWQRIEYTAKPLSRKELPWGGNYTEIIVHGIGRKVLIDSVKVEEGEKATPFVPGARTLDPRCNIKIGDKFAIPENTPKITVQKLKASFDIDGNPDKQAWSGIKTHVIKGSKAGDAARTEFKIATDGMFLYFGIKCYEPDMKNIRLAETKHDSPVWNDDSVEIMLKPNLRAEEYYHYALNANGVTTELQERKQGLAWNGTWEAKTLKANDHWSAEIKIPAYSPKECGPAGTPWLCNIGRTRAGGKAVEHLIWSGTEFHDLQSYAVLYGTPDAVQMATFKGMEEQIDGDFYVLKYSFENTSGKTLNWAFQTQIGQEKKNRGAPISVPAGMRKDFELKIPLKNIPDDFIVTAMLVGEKGRTLTSDYRHFIIKKLVEGPMLRHQICLKNEKQVEYRLSFPRIVNQKNAVLVVTLTDENGKEAFRSEKKFTSNQTSGMVPLERLAFGKYEFKADVRKNGESVIFKTLSMQCLPDPAGESVVRADRFKRILTYNGKPMIGLGAWLSSSGPVNDTSRELPLKDGAAQGVQLTWAPDWGKMFQKEELLHFLDLCHKNNQKAFVFWKLCFFGYPCGFCKEGKCSSRKTGDVTKATNLDPEKLKHNLELLKLVRKHPAFMGNYMADEPAPTNLEKVKTVVDKFKSEDPYHPTFVMLNNASGVRIFSPYMNEVVMLDDYNRNNGAIYYNSKEVRSYAPYRAMWYYIHSIPGTTMRKALVPEELRNMAYQVIVNGGSSIWPFTYKPWDHAIWDEWKNLAHEMKVLEPAIACEDFSDLELDGVAVSYRDTKDALYIITLSITDAEKTVSIPVPEKWKNAKRAEVLFENRSQDIRNGTISDKYGEYTRHVYKIVK